MIVFLTLCYVAILAVLIKLKVIKLNTFWKLSPVLWMVLLLVVLFIPMQWGAPSGSVTMYNFVVSIVPNVSGKVIEVPVEPLKPLKKGDVLFRIDPAPFQYKLDESKASLKAEEASRDLAKIQLARNRKLARQSAAAQSSVDEWSARYEGSLAAIQGIGAQIKDAEWNLEQTVVRAPADGFVIGLTLRPGQRVTTMPLSSPLSFVNQGEAQLIVGITQNMLRHVKPGQKAEVVLKLHPGKVLGAVVEEIAYMTPQGQLTPSGNVPLAPTGQQPPDPYGVLLKLDEDLSESLLVPGGALGTGAVYTDSVKATHVIRKVMMRMQAWMNYINPY